MSNRTSGKRSSMLLLVSTEIAVWMTKLFDRCDVASCEEARRVFLGREKDLRALCFAAVLGGTYNEKRRAAELGDAFAQARMAWRSVGEERFQGVEKSVAKENAMVSTTSGFATDMEVDARKTLKEQRRFFWPQLNLGMLPRWFVWAGSLTKTILNDLFGLGELLQMESLPGS
jgi:hypothetical protein